MEFATLVASLVLDPSSSTEVSGRAALLPSVSLPTNRRPVPRLRTGRPYRSPWPDIQTAFGLTPEELGAKVEVFAQQVLILGPGGYRFGDYWRKVMDGWRPPKERAGG